MRAVFNREKVAMGRCYYRQTFVVPIDHEYQFSTEFGFFLPFHQGMHHFVSLLKKEVSLAEFIKGDNNGSLLRINHLGKVSTVTVDVAKNTIIEMPVSSLQWASFGIPETPLKSTNAAFDYLLQGCKTIEQAIQRIEHSSAEGFYDPLIWDVKEVGEILTKKGFTKSIPTSYVEKLEAFLK